MSGRWKGFLILLGLQTALAGAAAVTELAFPCGGCRTGKIPWGSVGVIVYAGLFFTAVREGPSRLLFSGLFIAFGVHGALAVQLLLGGLTCGLCFGAAGLSLALVALAVAFDRSNGRLLLALLPWSVLAVFLLTGGPRAPRLAETQPGDPRAVRVTVFTSPDCPYCDELRDRVVPEIEREFGARVEIVYRPAGDLPAIRRTPTLIISPGRRDHHSRVIEGLPSVDALRSAIRTVEAES